MTVFVRPTEYDVTAYPYENVERLAFSLQVAWRGPGDKYAICRHGHVWNFRTKEWEYESSPSNRTDAMKRDTRRGLDEALDQAKWLAPFLSVNGWTLTQAIRMHNGESLCGGLVERGVPL